MKSPNPKGRKGPERLQDWYRALVWSARDLREGDTILVISGFEEKGFSERDRYVEILLALGVPRERIMVINEGQETVGQLEAMARVATGRTCIVYCSIAHFPRVWWLTRRERVRRRLVAGIPRPKELLTDIFLAVAFPVLDLFGKRAWFLRRVARRRQEGVL